MKIYNINFKEESEYIKIKGNFYKKEDFLDFIRKMYNRELLRLESLKQEKDLFSFKFVIDDKLEEIILDIKINSNDYYFESLRKIGKSCKKRKFKTIFKKSFYLTSLIVLLLTYIYESAYRNISDKVVEEVEVFDSLFETYLEENSKLSQLEVDTIEKFKNDAWIKENKSYSIEKVNPYIKMFNVDKTIDKAFMKVNLLTQKEYTHKVDFNLLFDFEKNMLKKEESIEYIYNYSLANVNNFYNGRYKVMSKEELEAFVIDVNIYIFNMLSLELEFDLEHFLCQLFNTVVLVSEDYSFELEEVSAQTTWSEYGNCIVFNKYNINWYPEHLDDIRYHEDNHLNENFCVCEDGNILIDSNGFYINSSRVYSYNFINEWASEVIGNNCDNNTHINSYYLENEVVHNLELALSINPKYKCGSILKSNIERNPINFYKLFPYIYSEREEVMEYVQMLHCYDIALSNTNYEIYLYYAQMKHIEIFYKNLFYLNESDDADIEYTYFLINLFETSMRSQSNELNSKVDIDSLLEYGYKNLFLEYMTRKYPNINLEEFRKNNNYSVSDMIEIDIESKFPKYFDFEKTKLYEEIVLNLFYKENSFKYDKCDSFQFILKDKLKY